MDMEGHLYLQLYLFLKQSPGNILFSQQKDETSSWQDEPGVDFVRFIHELPLFLMYQLCHWVFPKTKISRNPTTNE